MAHHAAQRRRRFHHLHRLVPANFRLVAFRRRRVDLRARLPVCHQQIQPDAGGPRRFAVFPWHLDVSGAEPSQPVRPLPPEEVPGHELLPRAQLERLAGPLPLGMFQEAEKLDRVFRRGPVEMQSPARGLFQVIQMPLCSLFYPLARRDVAVQHAVHIRRHRVHRHCAAASLFVCPRNSANGSTASRCGVLSLLRLLGSSPNRPPIFIIWSKYFAAMETSGRGWK